MGDGSGGVGQTVTDTLKDIGKDLTVNLAKDIFEQVSGGKKPAANQSSSNQNNAQLGNIQKNIKIANLSRRIQLFKQRRTQATQQSKQQEQMRLKQQEDDRKKLLEKQQKSGSIGGIVANMFANFANTLARRGKGEQRGNKASG
jgi:hypothetical protein